MAAKTCDAGQAGAPVRLNESGQTQILSRYDAGSTTISSGDTFIVAKVPNGATIVNIKAGGKSASTGGIVFNLGTSADASYFGPFTISGTHQFVPLTASSNTVNLPYTVSLSDDAVPQYLPIIATMASGTATNTGSFSVLIEYLARGAAGP